MIYRHFVWQLFLYKACILFMSDLNLTLPYYTPEWRSKRPIYRTTSQGGTSANRLIGPTLARQIKNSPLLSFVRELNALGL